MTTSIINRFKWYFPCCSETPALRAACFLARTLPYLGGYTWESFKPAAPLLSSIKYRMKFEFQRSCNYQRTIVLMLMKKLSPWHLPLASELVYCVLYHGCFGTRFALCQFSSQSLGRLFHHWWQSWPLQRTRQGGMTGLFWSGMGSRTYRKNRYIKNISDHDRSSK